MTMYNESSAKLDLNVHNKYKRPRGNHVCWYSKIRLATVECYHLTHCDGYSPSRKEHILVFRVIFLLPIHVLPISSQNSGLYYRVFKIYL